ncbi:MAG: pyridine nucleotide-disulfide oxidoreductase, partial [Sphingomonadaceae bacterium]|nr:pyridine nucleotide-disulfide oxidoreductase [Sphingomonadaceae bacterium]
MKRLALAALFALALIAWFQLGLGQYLTLESLKAQQAGIGAFYADNPLLVIAVYFMIYVALTALSVPGAAIMTLAG